MVPLHNATKLHKGFYTSVVCRVRHEGERAMIRFTTSVLPLAIAVMLFTSGAFAQNVHFKGGKKAGPQFSDQGLTLQTCVNLAGLGNQDVTILVEAEGFGTATCVNPGGNTAPGQNKVPLQVDATQTISAEEIKNGSLRSCLTTEAPGPVSAREAGCPNNNWAADFDDVVFESVTITVIQGGAGRVAAVLHSLTRALTRN